MISILYHHLNSPLAQQTLGSGLLVLICDNCAGQNKNQYLIAFAAEISNPDSPFFLFRRVDFKFPAVGHTFLVCDRAFSVIERFGNGVKISAPHEWRDAIAKAFKSPQYVENLRQSVFQTWKASLSAKYKILRQRLLGEYIGKHELLRFADVMWCNFGEYSNRIHKNEMWFKYHLSPGDSWNKINIVKPSGNALFYSCLFHLLIVFSDHMQEHCWTFNLCTLLHLRLVRSRWIPCTSTAAIWTGSIMFYTRLRTPRSCRKRNQFRKPSGTLVEPKLLLVLTSKP